MSENRKLAAILAADVVGFSRLAATDEERTVARLRGLRTDLIDPAISVHHGRVVKRTGDGILIEFRSVVDAVRCAIEVQNGMVERNAGLPPERQILFRAGIHLGDVIEEADGDLMGDGINIAARLESICEPGAICLSEHAYLQVKSRLDLAVADLGDKDLKNIPEPVHVYSLEVGKPAQAKPVVTVAAVVTPPLRKERSLLLPIVGGITAIIVIIAAGAWYFLVRPGANLAANAPAHLSIVVLPFANLSNDPKQDYFADGITENLTTDLSRIRNSFVIARNTAFTYKGKSVDAKEIGKELDVRYVLEGSVQRDGNRVRVNAQLIDAESGAHLWADRFEEDLSDLFKLQDDVVARLANTLGYELVKAEAAKGAHSSNPDAIDLTMRGWALLNSAGRDKARHQEARNLFDYALKLDPQDAEAMVGIALIDTRGFLYGWMAHPDDTLASQLDLVAKALVINPNYAVGYYVKSYALFFAKRYAEAVEGARSATIIDPNSALGYYMLGSAEYPIGFCDQAIIHIKKAFTLSPRDLGRGAWHFALGNAESCVGHDDAVIEQDKRAIDAGFRSFLAYLAWAAAAASKGDDADAKSAMAEAHRLVPSFTIKWLAARGVWLPRQLDGLRKAGVPEDEPPKHLSIVVLPFQNLSGDPKQDYFADGITENLTTDVSRIRTSFVIARNTAFTYKGKNVDAKEIGKQLDVRYVLEGSVQRDGNRVRVNAQLIDAESGSHLWADRFEEDLADLFKLQDDVVARLARTLQVELVNAEAVRSLHERQQNPDAIDLTMQGWATVNRSSTRNSYSTAQRLFEAALKIDPVNAVALSGMAEIHRADFAYGWTGPQSDSFAKAMDEADRANTLDPALANPYYVKSTLLFYKMKVNDTVLGDQALSAANMALRADPSFAPAEYAIAATLELLGRYEEAKQHLAQAIKVSPRDPTVGRWYMQMGREEFGLRHFEQAAEWEHRAIDAGYRTITPYVTLAAADAELGRIEAARDAMADARRLNPNLSVAWFQTHIASFLYSPAGFLDAARKAGLPEESPSPPKHLSIVVLPFTNLSGDPKQDYFADGITENLTTDLSRIRNSFVIARNTAFTYKGKNVDAKEIGKELGVRYVLEGSVQRDGNRFRVNAQLIDAESGAHLWAERFEENLADLFKLQDDIVARLANTLGYELVKAEAAKGAHSTNPDAIDLTMQGWALLQQSLTKEVKLGAQRAFEEALHIDPDNADALAGEAETYYWDFVYWNNPKTDYDRKILVPADRAIANAPGTMWAYYAKSFYLCLTHRAAEGLEVAAAGLAMNSNLAPLYLARDCAELSLGRLEQGRVDVRQAMRLSPRDPDLINGRWHMYLGNIELALSHFDLSIDEELKAIHAGYASFVAYMHLAAAYAMAGKMAEAETALSEARRLNPQLTIKWATAHGPNEPVMFDGLRKAGLPEEEEPPPPKHLAIVVLPFTNLSGDPKQDYFADGITENLTTDLSRIRNSFVIARNTAFTFKGKSIDAKEIGKELGVRYVLEGSVQRDGNRVRVNAQLIDAEAGSHLWADRFEEDLVDLFKLQDDVVARLANSLRVELVNAEVRRPKPQNPNSIDLTMRGWSVLYRPPSREILVAARELFDQAIKLDSTNVDAITGLAYADLRLSIYGAPGTQTDAYARAITEVERAISIDPSRGMAYYVKGNALFYKMRDAEAAQQVLVAAETALRNDPALAGAYLVMSAAEEVLDKCAEAKANLEQAVRISPRDPEIGRWHAALSREQFCLGHLEEAVNEANTALDSGYRTFVSYVGLAVVYAAAGRHDEAALAMEQARKMNPDLSVRWLHEHLPSFIDNPPGFIAAARKAGLPEDSAPRLSIVVLPFTNLSGDAKQDYLADVLTDELTTYISRIPGSFVIARNTAFTYKGKPTDVKTIGKDLGVRYVLEGSIQPTDKRIRTNAQLIDTETGADLWAEVFDSEKTDLLQTQDEIVTRLARTLQIQLTDIEVARLQRTHPANPDAQELAMRCQSAIWNGPHGKQAEAGFHLCEQALEIDPSNVVALATLSTKFMARVLSAQSSDRQGDIKRADELVSRSLTIDPNSPDAHAAKSLVLSGQRQFQEAKAEAERAIALNPSQMDGYSQLCLVDLWTGQPESLIACVDKELQLSPRDPSRFFIMEWKGGAYLALRQDVQAIEWFRRSLAINPNYELAHAYLSAALALTGDNAEAREALAQYLSLPGTRSKTIAAFRNAYTNSDNPVYVAMRERFYDGLRKAGMPEQ